MRENLIKKVEEEFRDFIESIRKTGNIEQAINKAYEITIKQEILDMFEYDICENGIYPDEAIKKLLEVNNLLDFLYDKWMDFDGNIRESLEYSVDLAIDEL